MELPKDSIFYTFYEEPRKPRAVVISEWLAEHGIEHFEQTPEGQFVITEQIELKSGMQLPDFCKDIRLTQGMRMAHEDYPKATGREILELHRVSDCRELSEEPSFELRIMSVEEKTEEMRRTGIIAPISKLQIFCYDTSGCLEILKKDRADIEQYFRSKQVFPDFHPNFHPASYWGDGEASVSFYVRRRRDKCRPIIIKQQFAINDVCVDPTDFLHHVLPCTLKRDATLMQAYKAWDALQALLGPKVSHYIDALMNYDYDDWEFRERVVTPLITADNDIKLFFYRHNKEIFNGKCNTQFRYAFIAPSPTPFGEQTTVEEAGPADSYHLPNCTNSLSSIYC